MDEDRNPSVRAVLQELDDACGVEVEVADVVADLDPAVPVVKAAVELPAGGLGVLEGNLAEGQQAFGGLGSDLQREVVEDPRDGRRLLGTAAVGEEDGRRRDDLHVDGVIIHVGDSLVRVPAGIGDMPELFAAQHDGGLGGGIDAK